MKKTTTNTLKLRELYHLQVEPETGFWVLPHHQSGAGENGHQKVEKQVTDFFLKIELCFPPVSRNFIG